MADKIRVLTEPLTVDLVEGEVRLDGVPEVAVAMTRDAAIETGIRLVNAGIGIDEGTEERPGSR